MAYRLDFSNWKNRELIINYLAEGHAIINEQEELKKVVMKMK